MRVLKSAKRTLSVTVLAKYPALARRPATWAASRRRISCSCALSVRSTANVSSVEIDFGSRDASTGRSSLPWASADSDSPAATPNSRISSARSTPRRSSTV